MQKIELSHSFSHIAYKYNVMLSTSENNNVYASSVNQAVFIIASISTNNTTGIKPKLESEIRGRSSGRRRFVGQMFFSVEILEEKKR